MSEAVGHRCDDHRRVYPGISGGRAGDPAQLRSTIRQCAPQAVEKISYRVPTFYLSGNLVHFAAFKRHIGFYPGPSDIARFKKELKKYKSAKGSVQFPLDDPLPLELIAAIVEFRVGENSRKK